MIDHDQIAHNESLPVNFRVRAAQVALRLAHILHPQVRTAEKRLATLAERRPL